MPTFEEAAVRAKVFASVDSGRVDAMEAVAHACARSSEELPNALPLAGVLSAEGEQPRHLLGFPHDGVWLLAHLNRVSSARVLSLSLSRSRALLLERLGKGPLARSKTEAFGGCVMVVVVAGGCDWKIDVHRSLS